MMKCCKDFVLVDSSGATLQTNGSTETVFGRVVNIANSTADVSFTTVGIDDVVSPAILVPSGVSYTGDTLRLFKSVTFTITGDFSWEIYG